MSLSRMTSTQSNYYRLLTKEPNKPLQQQSICSVVPLQLAGFTIQAIDEHNAVVFEISLPTDKFALFRQHGEGWKRIRKNRTGELFVIQDWN